MNWGATPEDWTHLDLNLGLTEDLLPVVSNPNAKVSPASKMKGLGKTPSWYNGQGFVAGITGWTERRTDGAEIDRWAAQPDYGICLQTRRVRALDIDVEDEALAQEIENAFTSALERAGYDPAAVPVRSRENSGKRLLAFCVDGDLAKRTFRLAGGAGLVEFLATGQQFIAVGTHTSGARYTWGRDASPSIVGVEIPPVPAGGFEAAWGALVARFADPDTAHTSSGRARKRDEALDLDDPRVAWLEANWTTHGWGREQLFMECPFKDGHSSDSGETECAYFPAGTNGYEQGHYKCLHASCDGRPDESFDVAVGYAAELEAQVVEGFAELALPVVVDEEGKPVDEDTSAPKGLIRNQPKKGETFASIKAQLSNTVLALQHPGWFGMDVAYDDFLGTVVIRERGSKKKNLPISDALVVAMRLELERLGFDPVGPELMRATIEYVARQKTIDSGKDWIERLKWDGVPRIKRFMHTHFGCADRPYTRAVSLYWWTGLAGRVLQPGMQADMVPILVSPEGFYKTTALKKLVPPSCPGSYITIDLSHKDADLSRRMRGAVIGELEELRGLKGRSAEANKAWVTRTCEEWTPKYVEHATRLQRRLMFIGTTNGDTPLGTETGKRRWLPLRMETDANRPLIEADAEQLWAEAAARFEEGGHLWQDAYDLAKLEHEEFREQDSWETAVAKWHDEIGHAEIGQGGERAGNYTLVDVFMWALGKSAAQITRSDEVRMGNALQALGWTRKRMQVQGTRSYVYTPSCPTCPTSCPNSSEDRAA